jgi:hypothetical protein
MVRVRQMHLMGEIIRGTGKAPGSVPRRLVHSAPAAVQLLASRLFRGNLSTRSMKIGGFDFEKKFQFGLVREEVSLRHPAQHDSKACPLQIWKSERRTPHPRPLRVQGNRLRWR